MTKVLRTLNSCGYINQALIYTVALLLICLLSTKVLGSLTQETIQFTYNALAVGSQSVTELY